MRSRRWRQEEETTELKKEEKRVVEAQRRRILPKSFSRCGGSDSRHRGGNKLTVIGAVDPWKLRDRLEAKTRKKVAVISPLNPPEKNPAAAAADTNVPKPKEPATVVLKLRLHCDGCIQRIKKTVLKIKGVKDVTVDSQADLVTVTGTMDVESLPGHLREKLKRGVEVVPAKKVDSSASAAATAVGDGRGKEKSDEKKGKEGGEGGKEEAETVVTSALEASKVMFYGPYGYRVDMLHAPQLFSDENPNACCVM
ncbi:hypothetical protein HPP92_008281 [Vanilla planifolia]|uniref:HMA domain-containing protein n=1 Tax=Vanilla planifolia TaxID=51239 RepID=A0A835R5Q3_VANPL|nr:hypothetical protein HPP92_008281 [Vanilla planifolia]